MFDKVTSKAFTKFDNSNKTIPVNNLDFIYMINGSITITTSNKDMEQIIIKEGEILDPEVLEKRNITSIIKFEVKEISNGLILPNIEYKAFINVL